MKHKKAVFFSMTVVMFLIYLVLFYRTSAEVQKSEDRLSVGRSQIKVFDTYVREFDSLTIPSVLERSAVRALATRTAEGVIHGDPVFTKDELENGMNDRSWMGNEQTVSDLFRQSLSTMTLQGESNISYDIRTVRQISPWEIELNFTTNYTLKRFSMVWKSADKPVIINVSVIGLTYPAPYSRAIDKEWVGDAGSTGCYVTEIISDAEPCVSMNIIPPDFVPSP